MSHRQDERITDFGQREMRGITLAMDRLRKRERKAYRMYKVGKSYAEIGEANGTSADTARRDVERYAAEYRGRRDVGDC